MAMNLENLYSNYIDIEIRKLKQQQKLEEIARNRNVAVEEIKEENSEIEQYCKKIDEDSKKKDPKKAKKKKIIIIFYYLNIF